LKNIMIALGMGILLLSLVRQELGPPSLRGICFSQIDVRDLNADYIEECMVRDLKAMDALFDVPGAPVILVTSRVEWTRSDGLELTLTATLPNGFQATGRANDADVGSRRGDILELACARLAFDLASQGKALRKLQPQRKA
jgi:hypothetical protein